MGCLPPRVYISSANGATITGDWIPVTPDNASVVTWQVKSGGTLAATITVEGSNDPRANQMSGQVASADIIDITSVATGITNPAGAGGNCLVRLPGFYTAYVRLKYTNSGGSGALAVYQAGMAA